MITFSNPPGAPVPASRYSQAALVEGPGKRLVVSGQVGMAPDGQVPAEGKAQIRQALANLKAVLAAHGMGPAHLVKITVFLTDSSLVAPWRSLRDEALEGAAPTSTLLIVAGLASPRFLVEVEAEAFLSA
ncbi:RidA family protein [Roseococcus pinisoli]|uniref:RidA family protein n=1 Tax=Roseococcus pinisoli TaxID=2835040 RepID=A0ABS5Q8F8_9PROT|nr:RidA family protein [uncultured Roseococcus sp.]MBS7809486.1 RidA family protein [Roseococcus pinisoli]